MEKQEVQTASNLTEQERKMVDNMKLRGNLAESVELPINLHNQLLAIIDRLDRGLLQASMTIQDMASTRDALRDLRKGHK
jgi:hypothetical protein